MVDTRVLKYKGDKFVPLTNTKSVIDDNDNTLHNILTNFDLRIVEGYKYMGVATKETNPGIPNGKVYYIASEEGQYTNFGNLTIDKYGTFVLMFDGLSWILEELPLKVTSENVHDNITNTVLSESLITASEASEDVMDIDKTLITDALRKSEQRLEPFEKRQVLKNLGIEDLLNSLELQISDGYKYMGVANRNTDPSNVIGSVFYIAYEVGTYVNFNNIEIYNGEVCILKYDTIWSKDVIYFNLLDNKKQEVEGKFSYTRKDSEGNELYPKTILENIYDLNGNKLETILASKEDYLFDATELYTASENKTAISDIFKTNLYHAINNSKILFASVKTNDSVTNAILTFTNKLKDSSYFTAIGRDFRYTLLLSDTTNFVESQRQPISAPFNRYVNEKGSDIFHIETTADNSTIQQMLTTDKGEVIIPSVGDVFEMYETTEQLGTILHYSGIVTSRVEVNTYQDIILIGNDLTDDFMMIHHIKLIYDKDEGVSSLALRKAYHMIINPFDLEMNNRNILFNNDYSNSIFTVNELTTTNELKAIFINKYKENVLPKVGDMFVAYEDTDGKELLEAGTVISEYDSQDGFTLKIISNNAVLDYWVLHSIQFTYTTKLIFDSLKVKSAFHTVINPALIEHDKMAELYADVERLKNNSVLMNYQLDSINGENGEAAV